MALTLDKWVKSVDQYRSKSITKMSNEIFFRDPPRPVIQNHEYFYSPADGIILYQEVVKGKESLVEIKGKKFTLQQLMGDKEFTQPCLIIGIFMTMYDVHINRMPMDGVLWHHWLDNVTTMNKPMLFVEKGLLKNHVAYNAMDYLHGNARMWNKAYTRHLNYTWYMVQIADSDVKHIMPFNASQAVHWNQNERYGFVRWGSQVDLILPLYQGLDFEILQKVTDHVEAGVDPLIKIKR